MSQLSRSAVFLLSLVLFYAMMELPAKGGQRMKRVSSWHVGIAAEAFAAAQFARFGIDVSFSTAQISRNMI